MNRERRDSDMSKSGDASTKLAGTTQATHANRGLGGAIYGGSNLFPDQFALDNFRRHPKVGSMSDDANNPPKATPFPPCTDSEHTKQVSTAGYTAGLFALFACIALINAPTWPVAGGVAALAVMVTAVCSFMLKR
jgi:hypothetical protein